MNDILHLYPVIPRDKNFQVNDILHLYPVIPGDKNFQVNDIQCVIRALKIFLPSSILKQIIQKCKAFSCEVVPI